MPPVMGAIAFVMAITIGWDYATVMIAANPARRVLTFGLILQKSDGPMLRAKGWWG